MSRLWALPSPSTDNSSSTFKEWEVLSKESKPSILTIQNHFYLDQIDGDVYGIDYMEQEFDEAGPSEHQKHEESPFPKNSFEPTKPSAARKKKTKPNMVRASPVEKPIHLRDPKEVPARKTVQPKAIL
uniref:Uncharacterized protein n=1 Tax=Cannabis sativa TaxID=3483 RepID=A0A803QGC6_CANSA